MAWSPWLEIVAALLLFGLIVVGLGGLAGLIRVNEKFESEEDAVESERPEREPQTYRFKEFERLP
ncbi:hypothetical protein [uncultured Meiothermus sp.]|uniref:hypothetical protein n=1 Tax=uncultured Meiothermus sp. TaxID=157471 RepID=UPI0026235E50|nr:hypothetical protein [uncultured Meiothermus sp.]